MTSNFSRVIIDNMKKFIERIVFHNILSSLKNKEITLIIGPRQAGKTTLLLKLKILLEKERKTKVLYFNLDFPEDKNYFKNQLDLINYLDLKSGRKKTIVLIDEIQRLRDAGIFLKGLYDRKLPYKFIVSGSGSVELKEKIHESLVGRKEIIKVNTINFLEFVSWKTDYKTQKKIKDFFYFDKNQPTQFLKDYLIFGGYPRVILANTFDEKIKVMDDIIQSYLEKDIQELIKIEKKESFFNLIKIIASQIGQLISYKEISSTLGLDYETVKKYLFYLEKTFIIEKVTPFFKNIRKELSKTPVFYFNDLGFRNYLLDKWFSLYERTNDGFLFQNFVFLLLKSAEKFKYFNINYWRSKDKAEVDFVLNAGEIIIPVEVKNTHLKDIETSRSLLSFLEKYKPREALIINLSLDKEKKIKDTLVKTIPYWKLLLFEKSENKN